jgi:hypothetical protein
MISKEQASEVAEAILAVARNERPAPSVRHIPAMREFRDLPLPDSAAR